MMPLRLQHTVGAQLMFAIIITLLLKSEFRTSHNLAILSQVKFKFFTGCEIAERLHEPGKASGKAALRLALERQGGFTSTEQRETQVDKDRGPRRGDLSAHGQGWGPR